MARVAVTGSSGKLGRVVVEHLHEHGWDVVALDRALPVRADIVSSQVDLRPSRASTTGTTASTRSSTWPLSRLRDCARTRRPSTTT